MLKNFIKVTLRNLIKHKTYSFIHIIGLTIGIASLVLILKYVQFELSYDRFNQNAGQIYRVTDIQWAQTQAPLAGALREFYPEIINTVRIKKIDKVFIAYDQKKFYEENVIFSDPSIFDVFTFPLLKGNPHTALSSPYSVVITQEMAKKYFGGQDPIGKKFNYDGKYDFQVSGVLKNIPNNSHIKFGFVFSLVSAPAVFGNDFLENRENTTVYNYFQLDPKREISSVQARFEKFTKYYLGEELYNMSRTGNWRIEYKIQPLTSIHLHSDLGGEFEPNGDIASVYIFSIIAALVLLIACINYMNLSIARSMNRLKEIGIRKVIGADRRHIFYQFIGESLLLSFFAIFLAFSLTELLSPRLASLLGEKDIFTSRGPGYLFSLFGIALITGIVAGSYPAFILSRFHPAKILSKTILKTNKRFNYRNALIVFQFFVSTVLIIAALIVNNQLSYVQKKNLGFNKEQVIVLPLNDDQVRKQCESLKDEMLKQSGIVNASLSSTIPGNVKFVRSFLWEGKKNEDENTMGFISVDHDFMKTYQIKIVEGRDFSNSFVTDAAQGFIINEAAQKKLGWKSPIGKMIMYHPKQGTVIGVMKDFHFKSLHDKIEPMVLYIDTPAFAYLSIRVNTQNIFGTLQAVENKWKLLYPDKPFEYFFLDEFWGKLYQKEQNIRNLFNCFSGLAIFIACLGLFGLAAFSAQNKTKEIGIRKVHGATVMGIVSMLLIEFTKWVIIASVIACPLAYYFMHKWLQDFAYRIEIYWWVYVISISMVLLIALATVSVNALKAATANPVKSLKYE
jgi:putative ABC transport system permease protein